jgi:hypothetical protein
MNFYYRRKKKNKEIIKFVCVHLIHLNIRVIQVHLSVYMHRNLYLRLQGQIKEYHLYMLDLQIVFDVDHANNYKYE